MSVEYTDTDGVTLAECRDNLANWYKAERAIQAGQEYTIDGLTVSRADVDTVARQIGFWQRKVNDKVAADQGAKNPGNQTASMTENPAVRGGPYRWGT